MEKSIVTSEYTVFLAVLRDIRRAAGITQVGLAELIGETQSQVSKLERGEVRLDIIELRTICIALGTTLSVFAEKLEKKLAKQNRSE